MPTDPESPLPFALRTGAGESSGREPKTFAQRALLAIVLAIAAVAIAGFVYAASDALLVLFICLLLALIFDAIAGVLGRVLRLPRPAALGLTVLLLVGAMLGGLATGGVGLFEQMPTLSAQLDESLNRLNHSLLHIGWLRNAVGTAKPANDALKAGSRAFGDAMNVFTVTFNALADLLVILVLSIYLSWSPQRYVDAAAALLPRRRRQRFREVLAASAQALRRWLLGQFAAMGCVFLFTTAGLFALGVNMAFALGVIAGTLTFVPYLGGILASVPAILIAFLDSPLQAGYVALLFAASYLVEGYFLTPMIQQRVVAIAPAFLLIAQLLAARAAGIGGVFAAAPLLVIVTVWVQMLYIEDYLADSTEVLGSDNPEKAPPSGAWKG